MSATEPGSPCIAVCVLDTDSGLCSGCFRTLVEIAAWASLGRLEKQRILDELPARRAAAGRPPSAA